MYTVPHFFDLHTRADPFVCRRFYQHSKAQKCCSRRTCLVRRLTQAAHTHKRLPSVSVPIGHSPIDIIVDAVEFPLRRTMAHVVLQFLKRLDVEESAALYHTLHNIAHSQQWPNEVCSNISDKVDPAPPLSEGSGWMPANDTFPFGPLASWTVCRLHLALCISPVVDSRYCLLRCARRDHLFLLSTQRK